MREILFRGKRIDNGEWVEGHYHYSNWYLPPSMKIVDTTYHILPIGHGDSHKVDPQTVGQFTGLTDKNGKRIFEGDIVKAVIVRDLGGGTENREETGIIGYDKIGMIGLIAKYAGTIPVWSDFFQELTLSGCINDFWFEVIGNIHDNLELLGGE